MHSAGSSVWHQREKRLQRQMRPVNQKMGLQLSRSSIDRTSGQIHWALAQLAESHSIVEADWVHRALRDDHIVLQGCWSREDDWSPRCISNRCVLKRA